MGLPTDRLVMAEIANQLLPNSEVLSLEPLKGGISASMAVLTLADQKREIHKFTLRKPGDWGDEEYATKASREFRKYRFAFESGLLCPEPIICFEEHNFFALRWVDGTPDPKLTNREQYLIQAPQRLAAIHRAPLLSIDRDLIPINFDELTSSRISRDVRTVLEQLAPPPSEPISLRHGDFWPGNILWKDDQIVAIIDWEEIQLGSPLADLAIARLDCLWVYGWEAVDAFTANYLNHNPLDTSWLAYWDLRCSQRVGDCHSDWAASYPSLGRPDVTAEHMRTLQAEFINDALQRLGE